MMGSFFTDKIIAAIIATVSSIIVAIIGVIIDRQLNKKNILAEREILERNIQHEISQSNKVLSIQYVTDKRVDWIYEVREILSNFISLSYLIADKYRLLDKKVDYELYRGLNKSISKLKLLFNFSGKIDKEILELVDKIVNNISDENFKAEEFQKDIYSVTKQSQIYLKLEWERVKLEATSTLQKAEIEKELCKKAKELYEIYPNKLG